MITVRRLAADEGPLLRRMRLAALADSPGEFATTMAQAERVSDDQWVATATAHAASDDQATFVAEADHQVVGLVGAYRTVDDRVTMVGLWSAPGHRDVGVADALLDAVLVWAGSVGAVQVRLWLVQRSELAGAFYLARGFEATGETIPYERDPRIGQIELIATLAGGERRRPLR